MAATPGPDEPRAAWSRMVALGLVIAACLSVKTLHFPSFFFHDDIQHQYLPIYRAIGQGLWEGRLVLDVASTWFGGDVLGEYQYAVFNPLALATYAALPLFEDMWLAAAWVMGVWYAFLLTGTYLLLRPRAGHWPALLAVAITGTNPLLAYWFASAWAPGLLSLAWFPWLLMGLWGGLWSRDPGPRGPLLVALGAFGIATAGWPHGLLVLALVLASLLPWHARDARSLGRLLRAAWLPATAGVLLAAAAWLPLVTAMGSVGRPSVLANNNELVAPLTAVLNAGFPSHVEQMMFIWHERRFAAPYFYVSALLLAWPLWMTRERWRELLRDAPTGALLLTVAVLVVASQGPSHVGTLRWPFRFLMYASLFVPVLMAIALGRGFLAPTSGRILGSLALAGGAALLAWQRAPDQALPHLSAWLAVTVLIGLTAWLASRRGFRAAMLTWIGGTLFLALDMHTTKPANAMVADWAPPRMLSQYELPPGVGPGDRVLFVYDRPAPGQTGGPDLYSGNLGLLRGLDSINGYSPLMPRHVGIPYCMNLFGATCERVASALTGVNPEFDATHAELAGRTRVVVQRRMRAVVEALEASPRFETCASSAQVQVFCSTRTTQLPHPASAATAGLEIRAARLVAADGGVELDVRHPGAAPGRIVLAVPWRSGWAARLHPGSGGEPGAAVAAAHPSGAVMIEVPPGFRGQIQARRHFPHLVPALALMLGGAVVLGLGLLLHKRGQERPAQPRAAGWLGVLEVISLGVTQQVAAQIGGTALPASSHAASAGFVVATARVAPAHLRLGLATLGTLFGLCARLTTGRALCSLDPAQRWARIQAWRSSRIGPLRDFVRYAESLAVLHFASMRHGAQVRSGEGPGLGR
jgi:hypothetical protein